MSNPNACPATGGGSCPMGIDPHSIRAIHARLDAMTQVMMATREDVVHVRAKVDHQDQRAEDFVSRLDAVEENVDELKTHRVVEKSSWNGPKRIIAVVGAVGVLIAAATGLANLIALAGLG